MRKPRTFDNVEALQETARLYRKALWRDAEVTVEVWCEKDALGAVAICVGIEVGAISSVTRLPHQAARSMI